MPGIKVKDNESLEHMSSKHKKKLKNKCKKIKKDNILSD